MTLLVTLNQYILVLMISYSLELKKEIFFQTSHIYGLRTALSIYDINPCLFVTYDIQYHIKEKCLWMSHFFRVHMSFHLERQQC